MGRAVKRHVRCCTAYCIAQLPSAGELESFLKVKPHRWGPDTRSARQVVRMGRETRAMVVGALVDDANEGMLRKGRLILGYRVSRLKVYSPPVVHNIYSNTGPTE